MYGSHNAQGVWLIQLLCRLDSEDTEWPSAGAESEGEVLHVSCIIHPQNNRSN